MRYYKAHEGAYQTLLKEGGDTWGKDNFENVYMLAFLKRALAQTALDKREDVCALVVGCGTGPLACALGRRGYRVHGFDISPTAIELAREQAQQRGLEIEYWVGDLCRDELRKSYYDLVVDSHCLHCIVLDDDRKKAFSSIRSSLKQKGIFVSEMMLGEARAPENYVIDRDGVYPSHRRQRHDRLSTQCPADHPNRKRIREDHPARRSKHRLFTQSYADPRGTVRLQAMVKVSPEGAVTLSTYFSAK